MFLSKHLLRRHIERYYQLIEVMVSLSLRCTKGNKDVDTRGPRVILDFYPNLQSDSGLHANELIGLYSEQNLSFSGLKTLSKFLFTAIITLTSVRRSTEQISCADAVRSMVGAMEKFDTANFESNDLITELPKCFLKIFDNDPDVVPIRRPLLSSSSSVSISL